MIYYPTLDATAFESKEHHTQRYNTRYKNLSVVVGAYVAHVSRFAAAEVLAAKAVQMQRQRPKRQNP